MLSGDDAMTLPLMALGGRGVISVASNEIPAEMAQIVRLASRNDFAARAKFTSDIAADGSEFRGVESRSR